MKQCPRCRKNLVDSATACTFCRHPLPSAAPPAWRPAAPTPAARPPGRPPVPFPAAGLPRRPSSSAGRNEATTLNPFVLFGRCFRLGGSFRRRAFAVVYLGALAAFCGVAFLVPFTLALLGASDAVALRGTAFAVTAMLPFVAVATLGGSIRRWHDLGKPGWYVLLWLLPLANGLALLYLLLAPGESRVRAA